MATTARYAIEPRHAYASDLTDTEWQEFAPLVTRCADTGRPRTVNLREIMNALLYLTHTRCQWWMLPHDLPYWQQVAYYFYKWTKDGTIEALNTSCAARFGSKLGVIPNHVLRLLIAKP
jgi:putative transposase